MSREESEDTGYMWRDVSSRAGYVIAKKFFLVFFW